MFEIEPYIPSQRENHEDNLWVKSECYRFYVQQRQLYCDFLEILDLWLLAPYCAACAASDPFEGNRCPDITPNGWELDIICEVGFEIHERTMKFLKEDPDFAYECKKCANELRPWEKDEIYVVKYHLEEHYGIPLETPGRKKPPRKVQIQIKKLYGNKCFRCDSEKKALHIDHILPQTKGGDAAFRNLQPLCEQCGNKKRDKIPKEILIWSTIYFGPYPTDSYEHLFW